MKVIRLQADGTHVTEDREWIHGFRIDDKVVCPYCGQSYVCRYMVGDKLYAECWCGARLMATRPEITT